MIKEFGSNIQDIAVVDNIVAYILSRFPSTSVDKCKPGIIKSKCRVDELFNIVREENNEYFSQ